MKMIKILSTFVLSTFAAGCASRTVPEEFPSGSAAALSTPSGKEWRPQELASLDVSPSFQSSTMAEGHGNHESHWRDGSDQPHDHRHHGHHHPGDPSGVTTESEASDHDHGAGTLSGEIYTCPMHPEVTAKEPGQCPKCGMNLEKQK